MYRMMRKIRRPKRALVHRRESAGSGRQSIARGTLPDERDELDADFDAVDIDDVVRQARNGRIDVSELDAL